MLRSGLGPMADGTIEIITGKERRRRWSAEEKLRIVAEVAERGARLLFNWRRQVREGRLGTSGSAGLYRSGCCHLHRRRQPRRTTAAQPALKSPCRMALVCTLPTKRNCRCCGLSSRRCAHDRAAAQCACVAGLRAHRHAPRLRWSVIAGAAATRSGSVQRPAVCFSAVGAANDRHSAYSFLLTHFPQPILTAEHCHIQT
jgi:transposase-like protein